MKNKFARLNMLDNRLPLIHGHSYTDLDTSYEFDDICYEKYRLNILIDMNKNTRQTEIMSCKLTRCMSKDCIGIYRSLMNKSVYTEMCYIYVPINKRKEVRNSIIKHNNTFVYSLQ